LRLVKKEYVMEEDNDCTLFYFEYDYTLLVLCNINFAN